MNTGAQMLKYNKFLSNPDIDSPTKNELDTKIGFGVTMKTTKDSFGLDDSLNKINRDW